MIKIEHGGGGGRELALVGSDLGRGSAGWLAVGGVEHGGGGGGGHQLTVGYGGGGGHVTCFTLGEHGRAVLHRGLAAGGVEHGGGGGVGQQLAVG